MTYRVTIMRQDEHLLEKGHLAKTLEAVGCRVARAKDYSWKVKDMTPEFFISISSYTNTVPKLSYIHILPLSKVWLEEQSDDIVSVGGKTESFR